MCSLSHTRLPGAPDALGVAMPRLFDLRDHIHQCVPLQDTGPKQGLCNVFKQVFARP